MSHNSSYYKNFLEKIESRIEKQQIWDETASDDKSASVLATDASGASTILDQNNNKGVEFRRNQNLLRKDHIEGIKSFPSTKTDLNFTSKIFLFSISTENFIFKFVKFYLFINFFLIIIFYLISIKSLILFYIIWNYSY